MMDDDVDYIATEQQRARYSALEGLDPEKDPADAGHALQLSKVTGADPSLIYADVPAYEQRVKSHMVDEFLRNNPHLQDYANSHPLAPLVSANDWANLDALDEKVSAFARGGQSIASAAVKGFKEHWNLQDALNTGIPEQDKANRLYYSIATGLRLPITATTEALSSVLAGVHDGMVEALQQAGMPESQARYHARQFAATAEIEMARRMGPHEGIPRPNAELRKALGPWLKDAQKAEYFVKAGEEPPAALGGLVAEARKLEDKAAADHIDELMKTANATETKKLAPELLADNFVRPMTEEARVGLDAKALDILYPGDKVPEPDDGILGWVPGIEGQFARARATGADIDIPLADFAAKMDPKLLTDIKEHIRPTAGARTAEEWKRPVDEPAEEAKPEEPALDFAAEVSKLREGTPTPEVSKAVQDLEALRSKLSERPPHEPGVDFEADMSELEADLTKIPKDSPERAKLTALQGELLKGMRAEPIEAAAPPLEQPLHQRTFYHGTTRTFEEFEAGKGRSQNLGHYFTESPRVASNYAESGLAGDPSGRAQVRPVRLNIRNPKYITDAEYDKYSFLDPERIKELEAEGHDAIVLKREKDFRRPGPGDKAGDIQEAIVWRPEQITPKYSPSPLVETLRDISGLGPKGWDKAAGVVEEQPVEPGIVPLQTITDEPITGTDIKSTHAFSVADGLSEIQPDRLTGVTKTLNDFFGERLQKLVGDVPVKLVSGAGMEELAKARGRSDMGDARAMYILPEHEIIMREEVAHGLGGHAQAAHVLMHEASHAMTIRAMEEFPDLKDTAKALMDEADAGLNKASPADRSFHDYAFKNEREFMAEAISNGRFRDIISVIPLTKELAARLGLDKARGNTVWDAVRRITKDLLERLLRRKIPPTVLDGVLELGRRIEKVEVERKLKQLEDDAAHRDFIDSIEAGAPPGEPIPDYLQKAFTSGKALRMNNERLRRHLELAAQQHKEEIDFSRNQEILAQGRRTTKEWKDNVDRVRGESRKAISAQPDIAVDRYLREGILPNESKEPKVKLHRDSVPDEYRDRIPRDYMDADRGVHPDQLADRFGYQSGREVLEHLARLDEQRKLEGLTPAAHITSRVEAETQRRMERDYGRGAEDILADAKEHTFNPTTHDILHNELAALYEMGGQQPITKEAIKKFARTIYERLPHSLHSSAGYMAEMSRMREEIIDNLLEGKNIDALKAQEKLALLAHHAEWALKTEKLRGQFDRQWKNKWSRREPPGMDQSDVVWLHDVAEKVGLQPKRIAGDLERQKQLVEPAFDSLRDYVGHVSDLKDQTPDVINPGQFPVASWLLDLERGSHNNPYRKLDDLTHDELQDVFDSMKAIDHYSRNEKKYRVKGELEDLADVQKGLIERLKAAVDYKQISPGEKQKPSLARTVGSLLLNPESWAFRLDLGNALGPFNQLIVRPIMEGLYEERKLEREFNELWKGLPEIGKREAVVNPGLFKDPANPAELMKLDTNSLRAIIQNMGNPTQRKKLAAGYGIDNPDKIWDWLFNTVGITKEHFDFAKQMAGIFEKAFEGTEKSDIKRYGVAPQRIELGEIQTPWGMEKEWYHPLIADSTRRSPMLKAKDMIDESGFYRPAPASGFRKERQGAIYPIDLTFDLVPYKLKQILKYNAMAWRVSEVSKIVLDQKFRTAFKQYYGQEYEGALVKWLKDVAGNREWDPAGDRAIAETVGKIQENLSSAMIGFNLGTVLKHGPTALVYSAREAGPVNFAASALRMIREWPGAQEAWDQAHEKSAEISSRWRSMKENIRGTNEELFNKLDPARKFGTIREAIQLAGHYPVAVVDLFSAVPMWDAVYRDGIKRGLAEDDAVYAADTAVRRTHGSTIIGARAGVMRTRDPYGLVKTFMPFYNFMSNALQRNYEMMWRAKLAMTGREVPEMKGFEKESYEKGFKNLKFAMGGIMVYGVLTSLIEQAVDPLPAGKDEGNISYWGRALTRAYPSQIPFARDIFNAVFHGRDPSTGLVGSFARNVAEEFKPSTWTGMDPAKIFRKTNTLIGTLTGLTNEQVGKVGTYIFNLLANQKEDTIQGPVDAYEVYRHGTLRKQPRTAEELMQEIGGGRR